MTYYATKCSKEKVIALLLSNPEIVPEGIYSEYQTEKSQVILDIDHLADIEKAEVFERELDTNVEPSNKDEEGWNFQENHMVLSWDPYSDIPENKKIPFENFSLNMEFKTKGSYVNLFRLESRDLIDSDDEYEPNRVHKEIDLDKGLLYLSFAEDDEWGESVCDKMLNDDQWHKVSVVCMEGKHVQVTVDGEEFEVKTVQRTP